MFNSGVTNGVFNSGTKNEVNSGVRTGFGVRARASGFGAGWFLEEVDGFGASNVTDRLGVGVFTPKRSTIIPPLAGVADVATADFLVVNRGQLDSARTRYQ